MIYVPYSMTRSACDTRNVNVRGLIPYGDAIIAYVPHTHMYNTRSQFDGICIRNEFANHTQISGVIYSTLATHKYMN